ncbi:MAG: endonuclease/exonuclease/phosphatase family protein [Sphingobium sp.]
MITHVLPPRRRQTLRWLCCCFLSLVFAALLSGCRSFPERYFTQSLPETLPVPTIAGTPITLDILTYNIEGLQWPARSRRAHKLTQIGEILRALNASGHAPDLVLFQEAFSSAAIRSVKASGYPYMAGGPSRTQRSIDRTRVKKPGKPPLLKGELGIRFAGSGLVIASRYPILAIMSDPYSRKTCAGFDCLSNKGVMMVRVAIPGLPSPVDIASTHMNAQRASKVREGRHLAAHQAQVKELRMFLDRYHRPSNPLILGGDFNMRGSTARFDTFRRYVPMALVHEYCVTHAGCDIALSWDGDAPWMDTQDLQLFSSGLHVAVQPIRVEAMFDGSSGSPRLSDHDGFRVVYRLDSGSSSD